MFTTVLVTIHAARTHHAIGHFLRNAAQVVTQKFFWPCIILYSVLWHRWCALLICTPCTVVT